LILSINNWKVSQKSDKKSIKISKEKIKYEKKLKPEQNKRLAHYDRDSQINSIILGETSEEELHKFLVNIQAYCDGVGNTIGLGPLDFTGSGCEGDVLDLLKHLRQNN